MREHEDNGEFIQILYQQLIDKYHDIDIIAEKLIESNCSVHMVLGFKNAELTRCLLKHGCPLILPTADGTLTAEEVDLLMQSMRLNDLENLRALLDHGLDVNATDSEGWTPLYYWGKSNLNAEFLRLLLDYGAIPHMVIERGNGESSGKMQMEYIMTYGRRNIVRLLLQYEVDLDAEDQYGCTAIHYMVDNDCLNLREELRGRQFNVNARDNVGCTPLHSITSQGLNTAKFFIDMGADVNATSDDGSTPLSMLWEYSVDGEGDQRIVELLLRHGADTQIAASNHFIFDYDEIGTEYSCTESVLAHLVFIEARGTPIKEFMKNQIDKAASSKAYFEMCKRQVEKMRQVKVWKSVSLCEFLIANENKMERLVRKKQILKNLRRMRYKNEYLPYYQYLVRERILEALKIVEMRKKAAADLFEALEFSHNAYQVIAEMIISYLTELHLRKMYRL